jgi:putative Mn2+ efflux pump MntP
MKFLSNIKQLFYELTTENLGRIILSISLILIGWLLGLLYEPLQIIMVIGFTLFIFQGLYLISAGFYYTIKDFFDRRKKNKK